MQLIRRLTREEISEFGEYKKKILKAVSFLLEGDSLAQNWELLLEARDVEIGFLKSQIFKHEKKIKSLQRSNSRLYRKIAKLTKNG